jgi:hypothetical protein
MMAIDLIYNQSTSLPKNTSSIDDKQLKCMASQLNARTHPQQISGVANKHGRTSRASSLMHAFISMLPRAHTHTRTKDMVLSDFRPSLACCCRERRWSIWLAAVASPPQSSRDNLSLSLSLSLSRAGMSFARIIKRVPSMLSLCCSNYDAH